MPEYINPHNVGVDLIGPNGEIVRIAKKQRKVLSEYFDKYRSRGFIKLVSEYDGSTPPHQTRKPRVVRHAKPSNISVTKQVTPEQKSHRMVLRQQRVTNQPAKQPVPTKRIVGKVVPENIAVALANNLSIDSYPISNNIGVGILSYNRSASLKRLVDSIIKYTDITKTTIFISDDASTDQATIDYLNELASNKNIVIIRNTARLGIAGNSNRLLRCLSRFKHCLLLNDDVEILNVGWEYFYRDAMDVTGMSHLIFRQNGVYGAAAGDKVVVNGVEMSKVLDKPHGAVLAFTTNYIDNVGYFNEKYGLYGMEHVEWSEKAFTFGLQDNGYYDVVGSDQFFRIHPEQSAVENRAELFRAAKAQFANRTKDRCTPSDATVVLSIAYVIPFRNIGRDGAISTVVNNIRAQRYPVVNIILVEQDGSTKIDLQAVAPVQYKRVGDEGLFNKSLAFNTGVVAVTDTNVILHDADMLAQGRYTEHISKALTNYDSCHIGGRVLYTTMEACDQIVANKQVTTASTCDRAVAYYEGGSLACSVQTYWNVGGFNEEFKGYGCFLPNNYALTDTGYKPIQDVLGTDRLYTHEGQFMPITLRRREYDGEVYNIYVPGRLPIKGVTPEHPLLIKVNDTQYQWKMVKDLQIGDVPAITDFVPELVHDYCLNDVMEFDNSKNKFDVYDKMEEFCYLLGLYLADGVIQTPDKLRTLYYYLNENELFLAKHAESLVHRLHPNIGVNYDYVRDGCREVRVFNSLLAKLINGVAGKKTARNKVLSSAFINSRSDRELSYLLGGGCDGDANHSNGSESRLVYHTSSINLAMIYSGIMRRLGIAHSFGSRKGGSFEGSAEFTFDLCVNREYESLIQSIYPKPPYFGSNSIGKTKFGTIYDIKKYHYSGPVYNFEVEEDHSYVVNGICVHNCEDCDFYYRVSMHSRWLENREYDLIHLWHSRVSGWNDHHNANKILEQRLKQRTLLDRVHMQRVQLKTNGYIK